MSEMRLCAHCAEQFVPVQATQKYCCKRCKWAAWRLANLDKRRKRARERYHENIEMARKRQRDKGRKWRAAHREEFNNRMREYRAANRKKIRARNNKNYSAMRALALAARHFLKMEKQLNA